jgi:RNA 2',3'-cyclic 3'-phosphodiesterase
VSARLLDAERRLFFALWPDAPLRAAIARHLAPAVAAGTPVHPADLHVTLEFLGNLDAARIPVLQAIGARLRLPAAALVLDRLDWWRAPALVVARPSAPPAALLALQAELRAALASAGYRVDTRPFAPHLTLARRVGAPPSLAAVAPVEWPLGGLALVESAARTGGARYHPLASWA